MRNLFRQLFTNNRGFLIASALVLGGFQFILCAIVASLNLESTLEQIMTFAPPIFRSMIEQSLLGGSVEGMLSFGWNHPITHAVVTAVAITLASRAIAGEIETGAIELVLAQPLSRSAYLACHVLFGVTALALVVGAGVIGTVIGQRTFDIAPFAPQRLVELLLNLLLLQAAIFSLTLLVSAWGREAGRVAVAGVLAAVVSFLVNVVATLWPKAAFLLPYSLHSYYDPRAILVQGDFSVLDAVVLTAFVVLCAGSALRRLSTRDLP